MVLQVGRFDQWLHLPVHGNYLSGTTEHWAGKLLWIEGYCFSRLLSRQCDRRESDSSWFWIWAVWAGSEYLAHENYVGRGEVAVLMFAVI